MSLSTTGLLLTRVRSPALRRGKMVLFDVAPSSPCASGGEGVRVGASLIARRALLASWCGKAADTPASFVPLSCNRLCSSDCGCARTRHDDRRQMAEDSQHRWQKTRSTRTLLSVGGGWNASKIQLRTWAIGREHCEKDESTPAAPCPEKNGACITGSVKKLLCGGTTCCIVLCWLMSSDVIFVGNPSAISACSWRTRLPPGLPDGLWGWLCGAARRDSPCSCF